MYDVLLSLFAGIHRKVTILGPSVDPIPRPVTNAVVRIIPAVSCSSNPTFLGPSMSPTLPRYPPERLNRAIKDTHELLVFMGFSEIGG